MQSFVSELSYTVNGVAVKPDTVIALYDDSAKVMSLISLKYKGGVIVNYFAVGFSFSSSFSIPRTYDAGKNPPEVLGVYSDTTGFYVTAVYDSTGKPTQAVGTGILTLNSHNAQAQRLAGEFELRMKQFYADKNEFGTKTVDVKGSFNVIYFFLVRGIPPLVPARMIPPKR